MCYVVHVIFSIYNNCYNLGNNSKTIVFGNILMFKFILLAIKCSETINNAI